MPASFRFLFGGLGFAPKEAKPIAAAMSVSGGEGEREGWGDIVGGLVGWWVEGGGEWSCGVRLIY